jgi:hypothetical protein
MSELFLFGLKWNNIKRNFENLQQENAKPSRKPTLIEKVDFLKERKNV